MFYKKYVDFLFKNVMKLDNKSILFISLSHNEKLEKVIKDKCSDYGIDKIYFNYNNYEEKNDFLLNNDLDKIESSSLFDNKIWNKYAMMGAHFLTIIDYFKYEEKISSEKIFKASLTSFKTSSVYNYLLSYNKVKWTATFLPNKEWIKLFSKGKKEEDIYLLFNDLYMLDEDFDFFKQKMKKNTMNLNINKFDKIRIVNSLGTNLELYIDNSRWVSIFDYVVDGKNVIPNYPSYEIYTSPNCYKVNGIVYGSKPIVYNNGLIDKYYFKFEDGKIIEYGSETGEELLKEIFSFDEGSKRLGEVAIVELDNPISVYDKIFYTTLLDENSSCHLALGSGFKDIYQGKDEKEKYSNGLNHSKVHIDFMIGTNDTEIYGYKDKNEILIYKNGKFIFG